MAGTFNSANIRMQGRDRYGVNSGFDPSGKTVSNVSVPGGKSLNDIWAPWFGYKDESSFDLTNSHGGFMVGGDNMSLVGSENYTLPKAWQGRCIHLERVLTYGIATKDEFYTRFLLPYRVYDGMEIRWSSWNGFDHLLDEIPEEGTGRQVQTYFEESVAHTRRHGLAFKMEHGFQNTPMGQQNYYMNLQMIMQATIRTISAEIMTTLMEQPTYTQHLARVRSHTSTSANLNGRF